jgi:TPR repeat protein
MSLKPSECVSITPTEESLEDTVEKGNLAWILLRWQEALEIYKSVENRASGHSEGHIYYRLGLLYQRAPEHRELSANYLAKAFDIVQASALQGDCEALCDLGHMYENGNFVQSNVKLGMSYYQQAAERNFPRGQYNLAVLLQDEPASKDKSMEYYKLAARAEYPCAQYNLGCCLNRSKDWKNAVRFFAKAADWGDADAQRQLQTMFSNSQENIRSAAVDFLVEEWPHFHEKLETECQRTLIVFLLSIRKQLQVLPELQTLICKQIIRQWKSPHYQNKFTTQFVYKKLPPVSILPVR